MLVVDQTGVGRPVVDVLAERLRGRVTCRLCPVTITAGHAASAGDVALAETKKSHSASETSLGYGFRVLFITLQSQRGVQQVHNRL